MRKRKQQALNQTGADNDAAAGNQVAKFGLINGVRPTPRDGHSASVDSSGHMWVFGGDRHHMPFNDLYMIKLE